MTMTDDELLHRLAFALASPPVAPSEADEAALRALVTEPIDDDKTDVASVVALRPRHRRRPPRWAVAIGAGALVVGTPVVAAAAMGSDAPGPVGRLGEVFHPHSPDAPPTTVPAPPEPDATLDGQGEPSPTPADPSVGGVAPSESDDSSGSTGEVDDDLGDERGEVPDDDHSGPGSGYDVGASGSGSGSGSDEDGYEDDHDWSGSGSGDSDRSGSGWDDSDRSGSDSSGSDSSGSGSDGSSSGSGWGGDGDD
jgi:hypothetical protein